jgi:hypothetical protein
MLRANRQAASSSARLARSSLVRAVSAMPSAHAMMRLRQPSHSWFNPLFGAPSRPHPAARQPNHQRSHERRARPDRPSDWLTAAQREGPSRPPGPIKGSWGGGPRPPRVKRPVPPKHAPLPSSRPAALGVRQTSPRRAGLSSHRVMRLVSPCDGSSDKSGCARGPAVARQFSAFARRPRLGQTSGAAGAATG